MANAGPHTNGSQFFLTFIKCDWLNGKHTVFGRVVDGLPVLDALEKVGSNSGSTKQPCKIMDCGEVKSKKAEEAEIKAQQEKLNAKKEQIEAEKSAAAVKKAEKAAAKIAEKSEKIKDKKVAAIENEFAKLAKKEDVEMTSEEESPEEVVEVKKEEKKESAEEI